MAGEVVDDGQSPAIIPVQSEYAYLWIDRPRSVDLLIRGKRVRVANVRLPAALQLESAVLHDSVLVADAGADMHRNHTVPRLFHRLDRPLFDIRANDSMTVAGIDQDMRRFDLQLFIQLRAHIGQVVVSDRPDFSYRNGIYGDDYRCSGILLQGQCFDIQWIVDRPCVDIRI